MVWSGPVYDIFGCGATMMHQIRDRRNSFNALFAGSSPHDVGCRDPVLWLVFTKPVNVYIAIYMGGPLPKIKISTAFFPCEPQSR